MNRRLPLAAAAILALPALGLPTGSAPAAAPAGEERLVGPRDAIHWTAAHRSRGNEYLLAYRRSGFDQRGDFSETFVQRIGAAGNPLGRPVKVLEVRSGDGSVRGQQLVYNARADEYLLVWTRTLGAAGFDAPRGVHGMRISPDGGTIDGPRALVRAGDQPGWRVGLSEDPRVVVEPGGDGYYLAWDAVRGSQAVGVSGRRLSDALGRGTVRTLISGRRALMDHFEMALAPGGYLLATSFDEGADDTREGLWTVLLSRAGRRRGDDLFVDGRTHGHVLARNSRTGAFALAMRGPESDLRIHGLDRTGDPVDERSLPTHRKFPSPDVTTLHYNHRAGEFLLGWRGTGPPVRNDPPPTRSFLRSLSGAARPVRGAAILPPGRAIAAAAADSGRASWLVLVATADGLFAQVWRPT